MSTFLFNEIIFGPVQSRRLGVSLGINLLPLNSKLCNFNCLYCECGLNDYIGGDKGYLYSEEHIINELKKTLQSFKENNKPIDTITFAGNGEPTLHPEFSAIIDHTIELRNSIYPEAKIAVLSNATLIGRPLIHEALLKIEYNILKLDSGIEETIKRVNCPNGNFSLNKLISELKAFRDNLTLQTLFLKGNYNGFYFDNTSEHELDELLKLYSILQPKLVMIYTIARDTPVNSLEKIELSCLKSIAERVESLGIPVQISA